MPSSRLLGRYPSLKWGHPVSRAPFWIALRSLREGEMAHVPEPNLDPELSEDDLDSESTTSFSIPTACASILTLGGVFLVIGSFSPWTQDSGVTVHVTFYRNGLQLGTNQGFSVAGLFSIVFGVCAILSGTMRLAERHLPSWLDVSPIADGAVGVAVGLYGLAEATWWKHQLLVPVGRFATGQAIFSATAGYGIWLVVVGGWFVLVSGIFSRPVGRTLRQQVVVAAATTLTIAVAAVLLAPEWV